MTEPRKSTPIAGSQIPLRSVPDEAQAAAKHDRPAWPDPLGEAALHGLAGDVVRVIEPHSESDPAAILLQFLVAVGNIVGRTVHFVAEADAHYTNLFLVVVGVSSKGRKGTSWGWIVHLLKLADAHWVRERVVAGLSSGEGLIHHVRDRVEVEKESEKGNGLEVVVTDPGVDDKRLLVVESEFASVLKVLQRQGNTLSPVIRCAWDHGDLRTLVKSSPEAATGAHISIVGHVTKQELLRNMADTETSNGFANRFLWCCAKRSKLLPHGGNLSDEALLGLAAHLSEVLDAGLRAGRIARDEDANRLWEDVYPDLSEGRPGLLGSVTGRAEPQVMRIATIYAMLDRSPVIRRVHLEAGLEVWRFAFQSAAYIFGNALGDPVADTILRALKESPEGLSRSEIRDLFSRHAEKGRIESALGMLQESALAHRQSVPTGGRPEERWFHGPGAATRATEATKGPPGAGGEGCDQSDESDQSPDETLSSHKSLSSRPPEPSESDGEGPGPPAGDPDDAEFVA